jgi:hypothetical protein
MQVNRKSVALIACSNGYGHIRRLLILSQSIKRLMADPVIFAIEDDVRKISKSYDLPMPKVIDFDTKTRIRNWVDGSAGKWVLDIPNIDSYDVVVSDNLIEVLEIRGDAWISGSFFWHKSLDNCHKDLIRSSEYLLRRYSPRLVCSSLFSPSYIKDEKTQHAVGLFKLHKYDHLKLSIKNDALISCGNGAGTNLVDKVSDFINKIKSLEKAPFEVVWVDPIVFPEGRVPKWMKKAKYNVEMYNSVSVSIIRPGIGTVTDSLIFGARLFTFHESGNFEMFNNSKIISDLNIGSKFQYIDDAWNGAIQYSKNNLLKSKHKRYLEKIDFNGSEQMAQMILK